MLQVLWLLGLLCGDVVTLVLFLVMKIVQIVGTWLIFVLSLEFQLSYLVL